MPRGKKLGLDFCPGREGPVEKEYKSTKLEKAGISGSMRGTEGKSFGRFVGLKSGIIT